MLFMHLFGKGEQIGTLCYTLNDEKVAECTLIANDDVPKMTFLSMEKHILNKWFSLLRG